MSCPCSRSRGWWLLPLLLPACSQAPLPPAEAACDEGLTACDAACVDLASSLDHCGDCDSACDASSACFLGTCTQLGGLQQGREGHQAVTASDGRIYVFGGLTATLAQAAEVERYDPSTNRWEIVTQMSKPRPYLSVAEHDGSFWTMGGFDFSGSDSDPILGTVEIWDPTQGSNGWSNGGELSHLRSDAAVTTTSAGAILLIGGNDGDASDQVYFPPEMDVFDGASWSIEPFPRETWGARAVRLADGRVLVAGGLTKSTQNNVHIYDPADHMWRSAASLIPNRSLGAAMLGPDGRVYYAGGAEGNDPPVGVPSARVQAYDPDDDSWEEVAPLPDVRVDCSGATTADGRLLVIGGAAGPVQKGLATDVVLTFDFERGLWF